MQILPTPVVNFFYVYCANLAKSFNLTCNALSSTTCTAQSTCVWTFLRSQLGTRGVRTVLRRNRTVLYVFYAVLCVCWQTVFVRLVLTPYLKYSPRSGFCGLKSSRVPLLRLRVFLRAEAPESRNGQGHPGWATSRGPTCI
jgi:hypothetical protein